MGGVCAESVPPPALIDDREGDGAGATPGEAGRVSDPGVPGAATLWSLPLLGGGRRAVGGEQEAERGRDDERAEGEPAFTSAIIPESRRGKRETALHAIATFTNRRLILDYELEE